LNKILININRRIKKERKRKLILDRDPRRERNKRHEEGEEEREQNLRN
jgi:hypothetical protein